MVPPWPGLTRSAPSCPTTWPAASSPSLLPTFLALVSMPTSRGLTSSGKTQDASGPSIDSHPHHPHRKASAGSLLPITSWLSPDPRTLAQTIRLLLPVSSRHALAECAGASQINLPRPLILCHRLSNKGRARSTSLPPFRRGPDGQALPWRRISLRDKARAVVAQAEEMIEPRPDGQLSYLPRIPNM